MRRIAKTGLVTLTAIVFTVSAALAGERSHTVQPGESASSIAKRYYGDFELADLLLRYNEKAGTVIRPGERLRVPYCDVHRVKAGDSWSTLAKRYIGRASAYPIVAELNGRVPERPLQVGEEIVFPVILRQRLARGETLAALSQRFFDGADRGRLLQELNTLDDPRRLSVGQWIDIPLMALRLREDATKPVAISKPAPPPPPPVRFTEELREVSAAFDAGEFDRSQKLLDTLRGRIEAEGIPADRAEYWRLQSFVYVAFDRWAQACAASRSIPKGLGGEALDPTRVSPKIRNALSRCNRL